VRAGLVIPPYTGMAAVRMPAVFLSVCIPVHRRLIISARRRRLPKGAALLTGAAMSGMHSAAMAASGLTPAVSVPGALGIGAASGIALAAALLGFLLHRLRRQKSLLNELFEQAPLAVALTTMDDNVIRINRGFTEVFGYTPQAAVGRRLSELIVPAESRDEYRKQVALAAQGRRVDAEGVGCRRDGSRFPAAITLVPFSSPGEETAVYAVYRDITERQREEEARQASEGRWRAIFDHSAIGIAATDTQGKFIATNRAYRDMVGYSEEELRAISFMDLTWEEDRPVNAALFAEMWRGKRPQFQIEKRYWRKDGRSIWVRTTVSSIPGAGTTPPIAIGVVEDITERKQAEHRLREYERVVEGLQEMIVVVDRDYRYLIANQAYLNYRGLEREQVIGHLVSELTGEAFARVIESKMNECVQGRVVKFELTLTYAKRGLRDIFATYFPIESAAGIDRIAMVLDDVTERKRAERELQRSLQELHALNARLHNVREEERTRLARELHDELGQALTAIRIGLAALKTTPGLDRRVQSIDGLLGLVDETIHSVRRISTELRPGILDHLGLAAAVEWAAEEFQTRTAIQCHVGLAGMSLDVDAERTTALFRILQEALTNIARHAGATQVSIHLSEERGHLALEVRDNGRGIGEGQLRASGSLGILGMRERAMLLGGEFFIGDPGGGTVVRVRIPAADGRQAAANP